jgi:hypothetical protein
MPRLFRDIAVTLCLNGEPVGQSAHLRRTLPGRLSIWAASVSTDNIDSGMFGKPRGRRLGGSITQHVDDLATFKIHDRWSCTWFLSANSSLRYQRRGLAGSKEPRGA